MKHFFFILFFISLTIGFGQNYAEKEYYLVDSLDLDILSNVERNYIDSFLTIYHQAKHDSDRIVILKDLISRLNTVAYEKYQFFQYDLLLSQPNTEIFSTQKQCLITALNNLGIIYNNIYNNYSKAIQSYKNSLQLSIDLKDTVKINMCLFNIGRTYSDQGNVQKALQYYFKCLKSQELSKDSIGLAYCYNNIGFIYREQEDITKSLEYYKKSLNISKLIKLNNLTGTVYNNIGDCYMFNGDYDKAIELQLSGLEIRKELGDKLMVINSLTNIGTSYHKKNNIERAMFYYEKALTMSNEINHKKSLATLNYNLGEVNLDLGKINEALELGLKSYANAKEINTPFYYKISTSLLSKVYEKIGKYDRALEMYKVEIRMRDSIKNEETQKATIRQQTQYEFEKEQIRKENEAKEKARIKAEQLQRRDNLEYSLIFLGILLLFGIVLMLGFIKVSPNVAEGLIFFSFLILFEFILVFAEPYINEYTDGEPIYTLLANAAIALLIFPLHDVLESKLKKRIVKK